MLVCGGETREALLLLDEELARDAGLTTVAGDRGYVDPRDPILGRAGRIVRPYFGDRARLETRRLDVAGRPAAAGSAAPCCLTALATEAAFPCVGAGSTRPSAATATANRCTRPPR